MDAERIRIRPTVISGGYLIFKALDESEALRAIMGGEARIFPVASFSEERFPCVCYRRVSLSSSPVKTGRPADRGVWEVSCLSRDYLESLTMAEAVRAALDGDCDRMAGVFYSSDDLILEGVLHSRSCVLTDASEGAFENGVYSQDLEFEIRI